MRNSLTLLVAGLVVTSTAFSKSRVDNSFENVDPGERKKIEDLVTTIRGGQKLTRTEHVRDAHAKEHGCVDTAELTIKFDPKLDPATKKKLAVGYFKEGRVYKNVVVRFSPGPGNPAHDDRDGGAQGMALKIPLTAEEQKALLPVTGEDEYFVPEKYYKTFDIVTINHNREFFVNHIDDYNDFFTASGKIGKEGFGKSKEEKGKIAVKYLKELYTQIPGKPARPHEEALLFSINSIFPKNNLLETYNSWVPSLLGKEAIKYEIAPVTTLKPKDYKVPAGIDDVNDPNFISKVLAYELEQKENVFKLNVQLRLPEFPSVEEGAGIWPADKSPYLQVGELVIPKGTKFIDHKLCEAMSFNPAHASALHYPIGGTQRARSGGEDEKGLYEGIYSAVHKARNISAGNKPL